jgi:molybdopterin-synthase adenylyltransferase
MGLSDAEVARYGRQLVLPGLGPIAQEFLRAARVHVVGAGAVAGPALLYLAQAGVGTLYVDDGADVGAEDATAWLYRPSDVGEPRLFRAIAAVKASNAFAKARGHSTEADPTAALVCPASAATAREAAERARGAGLPHVVAVADGDGGEVVAVPPGAPCYACASRPGTGAPTGPAAAAALGALGALELVMLLGGVHQGTRGRRIDLVLGQPHARATTRVPGCACAQRAAV